MDPEDYKADDFKRDLKPGDRGDDVKKIQNIFLWFGKLFSYKVDINQSELDDGYYGDSTKKAADDWLQRWSAQFTDNPIAQGLIKLIANLVFHIDPDELNPANKRGDSYPISEYHYGDEKGYSVDTLAAGIWEKSNSVARIADLANKCVGLHEKGKNSGPIVEAFMGKGHDGEPWCGGFVHYVMENSLKGVYNQSDFRMALSFKKEASDHHAWHSTGLPQVGDVLVFSRGSDGVSGHVAIVTGVNPKTGDIIYVDGNDADAVRQRSCNMNPKNRPASLLGFSSTHELARDKGIAIIPDEPKPENAKPSVIFKSGANVKAAAFDANAVLRG